jgi:DNA repair ATPase RecN
VNGVPTSLRVVRSIADVLVDVNGQAASLALRDTQQQLLLLDRIAGVFVRV